MLGVVTNIQNPWSPSRCAPPCIHTRAAIPSAPIALAYAQTHPHPSTRPSAPPFVDDPTLVPLLHAPAFFPEDEFPGICDSHESHSHGSHSLCSACPATGWAVIARWVFTRTARRSYYFERKAPGTNESVCSCSSLRAHSQSTTLRCRRRPSPLAPLPPPPPPVSASTPRERSAKIGQTTTAHAPGTQAATNSAEMGGRCVAPPGVRLDRPDPEPGHDVRPERRRWRRVHNLCASGSATTPRVGSWESGPTRDPNRNVDRPSRSTASATRTCATTSTSGGATGH